MNNSIIMIGHPINLVGLRLGKLIDSFPNVCRVNNLKDPYPIIDKGERMTLWARREPQYHDPVPKHIDVLIRRTDHKVYYKKWKDKEEKCLSHASEHITKVLKYDNGYVPTTGVVLLSHLVHSLSYYPIFIVGWFDMNSKLHKCHSYSLEKLYIQYLINERKVYLIG